MRDYLQEEADERYEEAVRIVQETNRASTPLLQRKLKVGYVVSTLLMERLEADGLIGAKKEKKPREVLEVQLYQPRKPRKQLKVKRTRIKRGLHRFKRTEADLKREWLVHPKAWMRYKGLRGIYWHWLSIDVRKSEWKKWGDCLTCMMPMVSWEEGHCGHVIASQSCGEFLRFNRANLTLQHAACNSDRLTPMAAALNAINYDDRHGTGAWAKLFSLRKTECKEPTQDEYRVLIRAVPSYQEAVDNSTTTC